MHQTRLKTWCLLRIELLKSPLMQMCMQVSSGILDLSKQKYIYTRGQSTIMNRALVPLTFASKIADGNVCRYSWVVPGETALAFYKAKNPTDKPVIGISTYNVVPFEAGQYFNKIQCFCFEEQRLNPQEEVDMPVFFYIDPEFAEDPRMVLFCETSLLRRRNVPPRF
uniref:Cytochrome c oxidase assembly protein COX11, mitochondrial n=1 Tax=Canis lupus familiaris TaxID=9615 RepID=A0A8C0TUA1_CANLF